MNVFEEKRSFFRVPMLPVCEKRSKKVRMILEKVIYLYHNESIKLPHPIKVFDGARADDVFR